MYLIIAGIKCRSWLWDCCVELCTCCHFRNCFKCY